MCGGANARPCATIIGNDMPKKPMAVNRDTAQMKLKSPHNSNATSAVITITFPAKMTHFLDPNTRSNGP